MGLPWLHVVGSAPFNASNVAGDSDGERAAVRDQGVGGEDTRAAGVCQNRESWTGWPRLLAEDIRHVEQLRDALDPEHAAAPERGIEHEVAARE